MSFVTTSLFIVSAALFIAGCFGLAERRLHRYIHLMLGSLGLGFGAMGLALYLRGFHGWQIGLFWVGGVVLIALGVYFRRLLRRPAK